MLNNAVWGGVGRYSRKFKYKCHISVALCITLSTSLYAKHELNDDEVYEISDVSIDANATKVRNNTKTGVLTKVDSFGGTRTVTRELIEATTAVIVQWHDSNDGKDKQAKIGSGEQTYKLTIPEPKSDNEAFKKGEAKLNELQRGGINGNLSTTGRELRAGGKLKILGVTGLENIEFSIKSVSHDLNVNGYMVRVEFEG